MTTPTTRRVVLLAGIVALGAVAAARQSSTLNERLAAAGVYERIDRFAADSMRDDGTPGLALGLTSRDGLLRASTYGFADLAAKVPVVPEHLFEIGSISKSFTAIALLQQRDAGRFDPREPIVTYLPWFSLKSSFAPITGHHLLTHTAGLPRDRDDVPSSRFQAAALRDRVAGSPPGTRFAYSNVGYQILGYALEAIADQAYPDVIERGILRPLGMRSSESSITHDTRLRLAVGYESFYDDRPRHRSHPLVPATWLEYAAGDGALASTAGDMSAYVRMLLNRGAGPQGRILSEESFKLLITPAVKSDDDGSRYGYGLTIEEDEKDGRTIVRHSGGMVGYHSLLIADMTDGLGVILLANGPGSSGVASFALDAARAGLHGRPPPDAPARRPRPFVENAAEFAGAYSSPDGETLKVIADGDRLLLQLADRSVPLEPRGRDRFYADHPDYSRFLLRFAREKGVVVEASIGPRWYAGPRYAGPRSFDAPAAWAAYPGHYRTTHAWFSNFRVVLRKGTLLLVSPEGSEQTLVPLDAAGTEFTLDDKASAERLRFDTIVDGLALRVNLSGVDYYRSFTP
jgi:CubicO group peptidase (beta-lactamase class C family)